MSLGKKAVVLGGSIAGMCAAGAVAPYFDEVVVLERDVIADNMEHRRGVPQSKHPHFLLNSGRRAMDTLFPGYEDDLIDAGGMHLMPSVSAAHCEGAGWIPRAESTMSMVYASRLLIERVLRNKLAEVADITVHEGVNVTGLETVNGGKPGGAVTGVWLSGGAEGPGKRLIEADLVIDTLGRGSAVSAWLEKAGWPAPPIQSLDAGCTYTTQWFQKPAERPDDWWWHHMSIMPSGETGPHPVEHEFISQIFPIEGDRVLVTMGSWGHPMPRKEDEFIETARRLRAPAFARAVERCTPLSKVFVTKSTGNMRRRYDKLDNPPVGLLVIGDAICGFNPFYAQGMSSAGKCSVLLGEMLSKQTSAIEPGFYRSYFAEQSKLLDDIWTLALARDRGFANATGTDIAPAWQQRLTQRLSWPFFNLLSAATREDKYLEAHFTAVFNLDESVTEMVRDPKFLAGMAKFAVKKAFRRNKLPIGFDQTLDPPSQIYRDFEPHPGGPATVIERPAKTSAAPEASPVV